MKVKIKKLHPEARIPSYAKDGDAGLDMTAISINFDRDGNIVYGTGIAVEIPTGHVGLLLPRSSISSKSLMLTNHVGVLDSGYRGEIFFKFKPALCFNEQQAYTGEKYQIKDRIGQLIIIPYPKIEFEEVEELSKSERGTGGYGSTGK